MSQESRALTKSYSRVGVPKFQLRLVMKVVCSEVSVTIGQATKMNIDGKSLAGQRQSAD